MLLETAPPKVPELEVKTQLVIEQVLPSLETAPPREFVEELLVKMQLVRKKSELLDVV